MGAFWSMKNHVSICISGVYTCVYECTLLLIIQQNGRRLQQGEAACQLTIRLRYCGRRPGRDPIFQRSPSCPVCCHRTAASPTPGGDRKGRENTASVLEEVTHLPRGWWFAVSVTIILIFVRLLTLISALNVNVMPLNRIWLVVFTSQLIFPLPEFWELQLDANRRLNQDDQA